MTPQKLITGSDEDIWQQLAQDLGDDNVLEYEAVIEQNGKKIILDIDIDPGGGFESGYATTRFLTALEKNKNFELSVYKQNILAEAGKLFGLQDVKVGHEEIDKNFIIKTNDESLTKQLFSDYTVRKIFETMNELELGTTEQNVGDTIIRYFELVIEDGITNVDRLRQIYEAFIILINLIENKM